MHSPKMVVSGALALSFSFAALAYAGDNNTIYVRQESPVGSSGNTLSIDQSLTSSSTIAGPSISGLLPFVGLTLDSASQGQPRPALQYGEGNQATVKMTDGASGENGAVLLLMQNSSPGSQTPQFLQTGVAGNIANATIAGDSLGAVIQIGTANSATLELNNSRGLVGQFGSRLTAELTVAEGASGQIVQIGNNSTAALEVVAGESVTLTQVGSGLTYGADAPQVQVFTTNPGNVTITQTGF